VPEVCLRWLRCIYGDHEVAEVATVVEEIPKGKA
jgi:hypothetical protein